MIKDALKKLLPDTHPLRLAWHRSRGWLAALKEGFPAKKLRIILGRASGRKRGETPAIFDDARQLAHILPLRPETTIDDDVAVFGAPVPPAVRARRSGDTRWLPLCREPRRVGRPPRLLVLESGVLPG